MHDFAARPTARFRLEPSRAAGPGNRAGSGNPGPAPRSSPPLSPTETRVYILLLQRLTERQVAEQMGRSHNTIHVHVRNIYRKLGVRTRKQLLELPHQASTANSAKP